MMFLIASFQCKLSSFLISNMLFYLKELNSKSLRSFFKKMKFYLRSKEATNCKLFLSEHFFTHFSKLMLKNIILKRIKIF